MKHHYKWIPVITCCLFVLTGCAGPKFITRQPSSSKMMRAIPPDSKLFISLTCNDPVVNSVVQAKLARALRDTGKFSSVEYGAPTPESLGMTITISAKRSVWSRRYRGDFSRVSALGSIDSNGMMLTELHEARSGAGGVGGAGGLATCGEKHMIKSLTRWLVGDIADSVKQPVVTVN